MPKPNDDNQNADIGGDVSEEPEQSDEEDQVESLMEEFGTMSFKPRKRMEKGREHVIQIILGKGYSLRLLKASFIRRTLNENLKLEFFDGY